MNIVVLDGAALNPGDLSWDCLKQFGNLTVYDRTPNRDLAIQRIGNADLITTNKVPIDKTILDACPNLKLICCLSTGYNVVDIAHAKARGIPVCNVPAYSTAAVAQFTIALLLELCHRIGHHDRVVHEGKWAACPNFCFWDTPQVELAGMTMGIIGYGKIGQAVGRIAEALGMNVLAHSRTRREGHRYVDLDTLLVKSDIISLHCPLFPETQNLINATTISKMKDGAILLNTARGPIIDESAVAAALHSGKLRGAAMDVVSEEPISRYNPLLTAPNCIITPHMAWAPAQTRQRILDITVESIRAWQTGHPVHVVNP
ncbi:MAG: D-2-hydroxyacid dehydrogenase [Oscillospiraceae bacterium]|nr:D-2-hydroxyacid dehydrogenase [Oscillospiraceae bacterium]